jgi:hypothetical protein
VISSLSCLKPSLELNPSASLAQHRACRCCRRSFIVYNTNNDCLRQSYRRSSTVVTIALQIKCVISARSFSSLYRLSHCCCCRWSITISYTQFDMSQVHQMATKQFHKLLSQAKRVVVLTGAGVSAESGIPTFRGEGGLWRKYVSSH